MLRGGEAGGITAATSCVSLDAPQITSGKCVEFWYLLLLFTTFYLVVQSNSNADTIDMCDHFRGTFSFQSLPLVRPCHRAVTDSPPTL